MTLAARMVNFTIKGIFRAVCQVDDSEIARIPTHGPLILVGNHVNFLEAPVMFTHLTPRPIKTLVKTETWDNPFLGRLFRIWDAIPIRRFDMDLDAFRASMACLQAGNILAICPEGTRSGHGRLLKGQPGIVLLALKSDVPILPVVYYGGEVFWQNLKTLNRTPFTIRVGRAFKLKNCPQAPSKEIREQITSEIMYQMALILPERYRGHYADLSKMTTDYLDFDVELPK
jgi:1-acyl-sn-glycerol-3-phosphate acyltransferase